MKQPTIFQKETANILADVERRKQDLERLVIFESLFKGVNLSDVYYFSQSEYNTMYDGTGDRILTIRLTLKDDKKDSRLAHRLARRFHLRFAKSKGWDDNSLELKATVPATEDCPRVDITITGAVPRTCKIVETRTPLTAEEIEAAKLAALAKVATERVTRSLVCK